ncbi:hypothetical protein ACU19_06605 [Actinobaculum suis]|uniref:glycosyltransferase n=1 Tax=Actinobaculum suis TaxID=1657 RepID=UPI00066FFBBE|nr:glycosyltransferase [Actinobaculum suis]KMY23041.1 hypothetical protein ACU19_06605 [Actinobaculum suis]
MSESHTTRVVEDVAAFIVTRPASPTLTSTLTAALLGECVPATITILEATGAAETDISAENRAGINNALERVSGALGEIPAGVQITTQPVLAKNLGQAINRYCAQTASAGSAGAAGTLADNAAWLWILHEDSAPEPGALAALYRRGSSSRAIAAVGTKQIGWDDRRELLEVGIRATRSARRVPEIEPGDKDGGQLDGRSDVLAVGTAGMLLRESAWQEVGGFDPELGPFGDGLEISRRLRGAGWRVVVEPKAAVRHARLAFGTSHRNSYRERRLAQIYNAVLAAPAGLAPVLFVWYVLAALPRCLWRLLTKEPRLAHGELVAGLQLLGKIPALVRGRQRHRKSRTIGRAGIKDLEATGAEVRRAKRQTRRAERERIALAATPDPLTLRDQAKWRRRTRTARGVAIFIGLALSLGFALPMIGAGAVSGGAFLPDSWTGSEIIRGAAHSWLAAGDGGPGRIDALWLLLAPLALLGEPWGLNFGTVLLAVLYTSFFWAALAAFWAAGTLTRSPHIRALAALGWAAAPPLVGAVTAGSVAGAVFHIALPVALGALAGVGAAASARARETRSVSRRRGRTQPTETSTVSTAAATTATSPTTTANTPAATTAHEPAPVTSAFPPSVAGLGVCALAFVFLAAAAPVMLLVATVVALACLWRWRQLRMLWIAVPAWVLILPTLSANWRLLFAVPGMPVPSQPTWLGLLTFSPTLGRSATDIAKLWRDSGLAVPARITEFLGDVPLAIPVLAALLVLVAAAACLLRRRHWRRIRAGWALAAAGLLWAAASTRVVTGQYFVGSTAFPAYGWAGTGLSFALLGLFIVLVSGGDGLRTDISRRSFGPHQLLGLGSVGLVALAGLLSGGYGISMAVAGVGALQPVSGPAIPAIAVADQASGARGRVLALHADSNGVRAEIWRSAGLSTHEVTMARQAQAATCLAQNRACTDPASADLAAAVANLLEGNTDAANSLAAHAVSTVLIPAGESDAVAGALNAAPGLEYVTENESGKFWRVVASEGEPARLRIDGQAIPSGRHGAHVEIPAGGPAELSLAERADSGWQASLDGHTLPPVTSETISTGAGASANSGTGPENSAATENGAGAEARENTAGAAAGSWQQKWELPARTEPMMLTVGYRPGTDVLIGLAQALCGLVAIVVAIPIRRRKVVAA